MLGIRSPALQEVGDELIPGQLFNVFTLTEGRIAAVQDFAARDEALRAADARAPQWV